MLSAGVPTHIGLPPAPGVVQNGPAAVPGRWILSLGGVNGTAAEQLAKVNELVGRVRGDTVATRHLGAAGLVLLETPHGVEYGQLRASLARLGRFEYVEPDYIVGIDGTPDDPSFSSLWGMHNTGQTGGTADADIDAPEAWSLTTGDGSVVVGVIDTGVDYNHADLASNMWVNPGETAGNGIDDDGNGYVDDIYGWDFFNNDNNPFDDHSHGTHVAGTIAAAGNNAVGVAGVAWDAQIMALKFLGASGTGSTSGAVAAVNYATKMRKDHGVNLRLTNNSWGDGGFSQALYDAIAASGEQGLLFVAAVGNGGSDGVGDDNDALPQYPSSYELDNIIAVAASDHNDNLASFSNYGAASVDLAAPGDGIQSTVPGNGYASYSGTSMASPHVAGVAALLWSAQPLATVADVRAAILTGADAKTALAGVTATGARLNAYGALNPPEPMPAELRGTKWNDLDGDGVKDAGEPGLSGWTIFIDANNNGALDGGELSQTTDANGDYAFVGLSPGNYVLAEVPASGWTQTAPGAPPNAGFESNSFASWETLGPASIRDASFGTAPTQGTWQALITNAVGAAHHGSIESFLGISSGALSAVGNGTAVQGAALRRVVAARAGETISFDWNALTNEKTPESIYNDFSFVSITPAAVGATELADTGHAAFVTSPTHFNEETGYGTFSHTFTAGGVYLLGIGVVDVTDTAVDSGLLIDNAVLPGAGRHAVRLGASQVVTGLNFGNQSTAGGDGATIEALADSPDPVGKGNKVTLTATGVGAGAQKVVFYRESNGLPGLQPEPVTLGGDTNLGPDTDGGNGWSISISTKNFPLGLNTYYARAQDSSGDWGAEVGVTGWVNAKPTIGVLSLSANPVMKGQTLTLTAQNVADADGSVRRVQFYRDANGNGKWDPATDAHLGNDTSAEGGWSVTADTSAFPAGDNTFFAVARDNLDALSLVRKATGVVNVAPTVGGLTGSPDPVTQGQDLTLTAQGVADTSPGVVTMVQFFRESNGSPGLQTGTGGDANLGNDTEGADGWSLVRGTGTLATGVHTFYARAWDNNNAISNVVSTTVEVQAASLTAGTLTLTDSSTDASAESLTSPAPSPVLLLSQPVTLREIDDELAFQLKDDEPAGSHVLASWEEWLNGGGVRLSGVAE